MNKNFWNLLKEKIQLGQNSIEDSCTKQEIVLKGFISLITRRTYWPPLKKKREALEMEGIKWMAAALCDKRARKATDLKKNNWALTYFRPDSFTFPVELWEKISQPITVFGQVVPIQTNTEAGKKPCFIKARAAAFLKNSTSVTTSTKPLTKIGGDIDRISILFIAADPTDAARLRLGEESREIQEKLQLAKLRDRFLLHQRLSVRPEDLSQALLDLKPKIVHFSGHGAKTGALFFEDKLGATHLIQPDALAALFEKFSDLISCVILNSCYSEIQAQAIAKHINYVIGMNQEIGDQSAIAFSIGFYQALGAGRSLPEAFELGCVQIRLQGISEHLTPVLIKKS